VIDQGSGRHSKISKGKSISLRLTTSIILTVLVVSVCSNYVWYLKTRQKARADLEKNINRSISSIVDILEMPLWAYDEETIEDIGKLYAGNELIVRLRIKDSLGRTLFEISNDSTDESVYQSRDVFHGKKVAGSVEMGLTSIGYKRLMKQMVWSGIVTTLINLSVLILLTGFFLRMFLKNPINTLSTLVDSYASGNYVPAESSTPYMEFESVVNVITTMGDKITTQMEELRLAEKKFREIFENAVEGIFQFSPEGAFLNVNPAMAKLMGYDNPEDLIETVTDISRDCFESFEAFKAISASMALDKIVNAHEVCVKKKAGELAWIALSLRLVEDAEGGVLFYEGSMIDISDKKEKEEAEKRQKTADAANQAKTLFIAKMSHEIRTPLNSVLGMTELLKETSLSRNQQEYIDLLYSSGEFLQAIINDILDFSKIEAQQFEIDSIPFDLSEIVNDVSGLFAFKADEKNIRFESFLSPDISMHFKGDPVRLKQILINLIGNAVKFTAAGCVTIDISKKNNDRLDDHQEEVLFKITDTGIGIPEAKQEMIFKSFTQADSFVTRQFGGTGLGLSICKKLVEHMGGRIKLQSAEGEGAEFSFSIVFTCSEPLSAIAGSESVPDIGLPVLKILLVDDIPPNRTVIHKFLEPFAPQITDAGNGQEAVEKFFNNSYDLILMDVEMPVMNGLEATQIIRDWEKNNQAPYTPLIILSAHAFGEQRKKCYDTGCDDLLVKPIRKKDLIKSIGALFIDKIELTDIVKTSSQADEGNLNSKTPEALSNKETIQIDIDFEELFPDFVNYFHETLDNMRTAAAEQDFESLFRLGHGLKGSARNYELYQLGDIFLEIENASKENKMETIIFNVKKAKDYLNSINVEFINKG